MKDLVVKQTYQTHKGEEKHRWVQVGKLAENDRGSFLLINPGINFAAYMQPGKDMVMVSVFDEKPRPDAKRLPAEPPHPAAAEVDSPFDDDIPF